jgi:hypothetical protein
VTELGRGLIVLDAFIPVELVSFQADANNGPLNGIAKDLTRYCSLDDAVTADAILAGVLGIEPSRIRYIQEAGQFLGNLNQKRYLLARVTAGLRLAIARPPINLSNRDCHARTKFA